MSTPPVELIRRFVPVTTRFGHEDFLAAGPGPILRWHELEHLHRVLILADPGAGKTFEARARAAKLHQKGRKAFFIRIEAIDARFDQSFEVGTAPEFEAWLASGEDAWFFLDSVDEAQLETPRALETAIQLFGARIRDARERAHIYITSREDAWRDLPDDSLVEQHLPYGAPPEQPDDADPLAQPRGHNARGREHFLKTYRLDGLNLDEIKNFAGHCHVSDVNAFVDAIVRSGLRPLAERPFDLKALIANWQADFTLGSRFNVLRRTIDLQLSPLLSAPAPRIEKARALAGIRHLAASVTFTGLNRISLPASPPAPARLDPTRLLPDWSVDDLAALLATGVFDDVVYASVRFRHREIRELLTAEWAHHRLCQPELRAETEARFFRSIYGAEVIVPRFRPTLCWLILMDDAVRDRALALAPEIATEGGDASELPLSIRRTMLNGIVSDIATGNG